jgi:hypothetical protein
MAQEYLPIILPVYPSIRISALINNLPLENSKVSTLNGWERYNS